MSNGDEFKKTFNLDGTHQQLLDINKDTKNFVAEFKITPNILDFEVPYSVAVVTQSDLDNQGTIDFKTMTRAFAGTVKNVDGDGQNYFLAIKSEKPMKGLVFSLKLTEIIQPEPQPDSQMQGQGQGQGPQVHGQVPPMQGPHGQGQGQGQGYLGLTEDQAREILARQESVRESYMPSSNSTNGKLVKYVLAFFTVVVAGFLVYYFWKTNKKAQKPAQEGDYY